MQKNTGLHWMQTRFGNREKPLPASPKKRSADLQGFKNLEGLQLNAVYFSFQLNIEKIKNRLFYFF